MATSRTLVALLAMVALSAGARACEGSKVLYEDHFTSYDPSWGSSGPELTIDGGRMVIRPEAGMIYWQTNDLADYTAVDACVDVTFDESGVPDEVLAGLVFWYVDDDNLSVFQIDSAKHAALFQRTDGMWRETIPWGETEVVPAGDGKPVHLRVLVTPESASIYVGSDKLTEIPVNVPIPAAGTKVGLIAGSAATAVSTIAFDNFVLTAK